MFPWGIFPKILWVTLWVSTHHVSKPEVVIRPQTKIWEGAKVKILAILATSLAHARQIGFLYCVAS